jgi:hypothetical protein
MLTYQDMGNHVDLSGNEQDNHIAKDCLKNKVDLPCSFTKMYYTENILPI